MKKYCLIFFYVILSLVIAGCSNPEVERKQVLSEIKHDIEIPGWSMSIGSESNDIIDTQIASYEFSLLNYDVKEKYVKWIEPIYSKVFEKRLIKKIGKFDVNKAIKPGESIQVELKVKFDAKGLSKQQIISMEPFITNIKVITENNLTLQK